MGNNTLETILGGIGRKEQVNQYKEALVGDILPRNANGEVEDHSASLGGQSIRFLGANIDMIITNGIIIAGQDKSQTFLNSGTFIVPQNAGNLVVLSCGAGGNGGSGVNQYATDYAGGGGGGGGGVAIIRPSGYSAGDTLTVTISEGSSTVSINGKSVSCGAGGAGGAGYSSGDLNNWLTYGGAGGVGGATSNSGFSIDELIFARNGGNGGNGGYKFQVRGLSSSLVYRVENYREKGEKTYMTFGAGGNGGDSGAAGTAGTGFSGQSAGVLILWKEPA